MKINVLKILVNISLFLSAHLINAEILQASSPEIPFQLFYPDLGFKEWSEYIKKAFREQQEISKKEGDGTTDDEDIILELKNKLTQLHLVEIPEKINTIYKSCSDPKILEGIKKFTDPDSSKEARQSIASFYFVLTSENSGCADYVTLTMIQSFWDWKYKDSSNNYFLTFHEVILTWGTELSEIGKEFLLKALHQIFSNTPPELMIEGRKIQIPTLTENDLKILMPLLAFYDAYSFFDNREYFNPKIKTYPFPYGLFSYPKNERLIAKGIEYMNKGYYYYYSDINIYEVIQRIFFEKREKYYKTVTAFLKSNIDKSGNSENIEKTILEHYLGKDFNSNLDPMLFTLLLNISPNYLPNILFLYQTYDNYLLIYQHYQKIIFSNSDLKFQFLAFTLKNSNFKKYIDKEIIYNKDRLEDVFQIFTELTTQNRPEFNLLKTEIETYITDKFSTNFIQSIFKYLPKSESEPMDLFFFNLMSKQPIEKIIEIYDKKNTWVGDTYYYWRDSENYFFLNLLIRNIKLRLNKSFDQLNLLNFKKRNDLINSIEDQIIFYNTPLPGTSEFRSKPNREDLIFLFCTLIDKGSEGLKSLIDLLCRLKHYKLNYDWLLINHFFQNISEYKAYLGERPFSYADYDFNGNEKNNKYFINYYLKELLEKLNKQIQESKGKDAMIPFIGYFDAIYIWLGKYHNLFSNNVVIDGKTMKSDELYDEIIKTVFKSSPSIFIDYFFEGNFPIAPYFDFLILKISSLDKKEKLACLNSLLKGLNRATATPDMITKIVSMRPEDAKLLYPMLYHQFCYLALKLGVSYYLSEIISELKIVSNSQNLEELNQVFKYCSELYLSDSPIDLDILKGSLFKLELLYKTKIEFLKTHPNEENNKILIRTNSDYSEFLEIKKKLLKK